LTPERIEKLAAAIAEERERRREERRLADDYNPYFIWVANGEDADAVYRAAMADPALKGFDIELFAWTEWDPAAEAEWLAKLEQIREKAAADARAVLPAKPSEPDAEDASPVRVSSDQAVDEPARVEQPRTEVRWHAPPKHWMLY
jgi:hypothetical protein